MKISILIFLFNFLIFIITPTRILADTPLDFYINDFYSKSNEASQILKEIETSLKEGSREKVCLRQRYAGKLGLLANKSLIKAFKIGGTKPPMKEIKASNKKWKSILNEC